MPDYKNILVGIDFTPLCDTAVRAAVRVASQFESERMHLVHVTRPWAWPAPLALDESMAIAWQRVLDLAGRDLEAVDVPSTRTQIIRHVLAGPAARELAHAAREAHADLIVVATHGRGAVKRAMMGSVANGLVRGTHCPLLVVGEDRQGLAPFHRIVAAIDLSDVSARVLTHAQEMARATDAKLLVVSACHLPGGERAIPMSDSAQGPSPLVRLARKYREAVVDLVQGVLGPKARTQIEVVMSDSPARFILDAVEGENADLVVLGTSGHNAWERMLLGSTATRVVTQAHCPALVIPHRIDRAPLEQSAPNALESRPIRGS